MAKEHQHLVVETKRQIYQLEDALKTIHSTKRNLKDNVQEVKGQIRAAVSRQLESLRNREVWLLGQVDILEAAKDQIFRDQEDQLHHTIGSLTNSLEYSETDDDGLHLNGKLSESLEKLTSLEIRPLETACLRFRADPSSLRSAIHSFGRVDSKGVPLEGAFVHPGQTSSTSLPQTFEDYGDAEHHVLYKTLEDVKKEKHNDDSIQVSIPRLGKPLAEWLAWTPATTPSPTPTPTHPATFAFPPFTGVDVAQASVTSLHQWLADLKHGAEPEDDEDFELINPSRHHTISESSSIEMLQMPEVGVQGEEKMSILKYFHDMTQVPNRYWLSVGPVTSAWERDEIDRSSQMLAYFRDVMTSTEKWLTDFRNQHEPAGSCRRGVCSSSDDWVDIENLATLGCMDNHSVPQVPNVKSTSSAVWLAKTEDEDEKEIDEKEVITTMCRANEVCGSFSECVCEENCSRSNSTSTNSTANSSPLHQTIQHDDMFSHVSSSIRDWLAVANTAGKSLDGDIQQQGSTCKDILPCVPLKLQHWLKTSSSPAVMADVLESPLLSYFQTLPKVYTQWLADADTCVEPTSPVGTCASSALFPVFTSSQYTDNSDWLALPTPFIQPLEEPNTMAVDAHMAHVNARPVSFWLRGARSASVPAPSSRTTQDLTSHDFRCLPLTDELHHWLRESEPQKEFSSQKLSFVTSTRADDPMSDWLLPEAEPSSNTDQLKKAPSPTPEITVSVPTDDKLWLLGKSLCVDEEVDLDMPLVSETVAASVSQLFGKLGLGHGPWLKAGDNRHSIVESAEDEEDDSQWLKKKEKLTEKQDGLFTCFQQKDLSEWLNSNQLSA